MPQPNTDLSIPMPAPHVAAFEKLAFGMFIHWGLYSQLQEGEWIQHRKPIEFDEYIKLRDTFTAEDFDARAIARLARNAGMRYITLTTRHHDGFSLYDTCGLNDYDAPHAPAGRDLIREFVDGCRAEDIVPVFYHTTMDWHWRGKKTWDLDDAEFNVYLEYLKDSVEVLCTNYGDIGGLWFDGNWCRPEMDWRLDELYGMIRAKQPEAMIVNNTGLQHAGELGHPEIDAVTFEQQNAEPIDRRGAPKYVTGEMCQTTNFHWGIGRNDFAQKAPGEIIEFICNCRRCGANYLLNVGPTGEGAVPALEREILLQVGRWVELYGESIYEAKPTGVKCLGRDFVLRRGDALYYFAHDLRIRGHDNVTLSVGGAGFRQMTAFPKQRIKRAVWIDSDEPLEFTQDEDARFAAVNFTGFAYGWQTVVRVARIELEA